jgi:hypothetical protein
VGTYEIKAGSIVYYTVTVSLSGTDLLVNKTPVIPLSDTRFSWEGRQLEFVKDRDGKVTHLTWPVPEGAAKAVRKPEAK